MRVGTRANPLLDAYTSQPRHTFCRPFAACGALAGLQRPAASRDPADSFFENLTFSLWGNMSKKRPEEWKMKCRHFPYGDIQIKTAGGGNSAFWIFSYRIRVECFYFGNCFLAGGRTKSQPGPRHKSRKSNSRALTSLSKKYLRWG